ncbi:MAG: hypothetical protein GF372_02870 [Candidatus Marinimicrobia bacterium]|nr:hypothetical protein [Candidatus Neomarinimicrobiota bacterium]
MDDNQKNHYSWLKAQDALLHQEQQKYESLLAALLEILNSENSNIQSLVHEEISDLNTDLRSKNPRDEAFQQPECLNRFEALWKSARMEQNSFLPGFLQKES